MANQVKSYLENTRRYVAVAQQGDEDLGPLKHLPGTWRNGDNLAGRGWNMIALPFTTEPDGRLDYRLLVNQYNEELKFTLVDKGVPNRGVAGTPPSSNTDQFVVTLDFEQMIKQIAADDNPLSGLAGGTDLAIHHEPGLWLHMTNLQTNGLDVARLSTIPHGDSLLALGKSETINGPPVIPATNGLPIGVDQTITHPYLSPYKHYSDNPFKGNVGVAGFPGFDPVQPHKLLEGAIPGNVVRTTKLEVSTTVETGGIRNIPFIVKQADATEMVSTFWVSELDEMDASGNPRLIMQYLQIVMLDFFPRRDGQPGRIKWPHVSINTMERVSTPDATKAVMPSV